MKGSADVLADRYYGDGQRAHFGSRFRRRPLVRLRAEKLRVESPSAEVQGHSPSQKRTVTGKENVAIMGIEPVGNYAIKIIFDDGHDTAFILGTICASWRVRSLEPEGVSAGLGLIGTGLGALSRVAPSACNYFSKTGQTASINSCFVLVFALTVKSGRLTKAGTRAG